MKDYAKIDTSERDTFEVKLVHGIEFIAVFIAIVVGLLYLSELL